MDEEKLFDRFLTLPDGYQVQLMVMGRSAGRGFYRSRIWLGHESESEPMLYRGQVHPEFRLAVDACYSLMLHSAPQVFHSPAALAAVQQYADAYFSAGEQTRDLAVDTTTI